MALEQTLNTPKHRNGSGLFQEGNDLTSKHLVNRFANDPQCQPIAAVARHEAGPCGRVALQLFVAQERLSFDYAQTVHFEHVHRRLLTAELHELGWRFATGEYETTL